MRRRAVRGSDAGPGHARLRRTALLALVVPLAAAVTSPPLSLGSPALPGPAAQAAPAPATARPQTAPARMPAPTTRTTPAAFRSATPSSDLPAPALAAYQRAEAVINASSPGCSLSWRLLAAIAQVETDHGRRTPPVTRAGPDTDGGLYDGTPARDVLAGPFQIAPVTWAAVAVDADGDGTRDVHDLDDAALGLAVLLCGTHEDLATDAGRRAALRTQHRDPDYADLVLALAAAYLVSDRLSAGLSSPDLLAPHAMRAVLPEAALPAGGGATMSAPLPAGGSARTPGPTTAPEPLPDPAETPVPPPSEQSGDPQTPEQIPTGPASPEPCSPAPASPPADPPAPSDLVADPGEAPPVPTPAPTTGTGQAPEPGTDQAPDDASTEPFPEDVPPCPNQDPSDPDPVAPTNDPAPINASPAARPGATASREPGPADSRPHTTS